MKKLLIILLVLAASLKMFGQNEYKYVIYAYGGLRIGPEARITNMADIDSVKIVGSELLFYDGGVGYIAANSSPGDLLADGTVPLSANWDVGPYIITGTRFISDIATGTAPFGVSSTTVVSNLNADLLDGQTGSYYLDNVSTALSTGTVNAITYSITSDGGANDITLVEADTDNAGLLGADKWDEIVANTAKKTNAIHTGEVTGEDALTIADNVIEEANLEVTNAPTDNYLLSYDDGTAGFTWVVGAPGATSYDTVSLYGGDYFVAPWGSDSDDGSYDAPWLTWNYAFNELSAGDTLYIRGGVYYVTDANYYSSSRGLVVTNTDGTSTNRICVFNYPGEKPIFDGSQLAEAVSTKAMGFGNCSYWHLKGLTMRYFPQITAATTGGGFLGDHVSHFILENMIAYGNGGHGFNIYGGDGVSMTGNKFLNCDSYDNYDPESTSDGGDSDGFSIATLQNITDSTVLIGCRAWNNSDDGFEGFGTEGIVVFQDCWSFNNGYQADGNGQGIKMGNSDSVVSTTYIRQLYNCITVGNKANGIDENDATGLLKAVNCISYKNARGLHMSGADVASIYRNNMIYDNPSYAWAATNVNRIMDHNTYNVVYSPEGPVVTDADFFSLDTMQLYRPRKPDGSLPDITFGTLRPESSLVEGGIDVGLDYYGFRPDIGAIESGVTKGTNESESLYGGTYFVATWGNDSGNGSFEYPWLTWNYAFNELSAGDTLYIRGGVYYVTEATAANSTNAVTVDYSAATEDNRICVFNYPGEKPIFDGSLMETTESTNGLVISGYDYWHLKGLTVRNFNQGSGELATNGVLLYQANHTIIENMTAHNIQGTGFKQLASEAGQNTYNTYINCDSYDNYDPYTSPAGGDADGFSMNFQTNANDTTFLTGCRAWGNSDDGFDGWETEGTIIYQDCWSFNNGFVGGGDGNGFKHGQQTLTASAIYTREMYNCIGVANNASGLVEGGSKGLTRVLNFLSYGNGDHGINYDGTDVASIYRNNSVFGNTTSNYYGDHAVKTHDHNSYDATYEPNGPVASASDYFSLDTIQLYRPRKWDGSLPDITFGSLRPNSDLAEAGIDVGLDYHGYFPDIGAIESGVATGVDSAVAELSAYLEETSFYGDWETGVVTGGYNQFSWRYKEEDVADGRITLITSDSARQGNIYARFEVQSGDEAGGAERAEVSGMDDYTHTRIIEDDSSGIVRYEFSVYFPIGWDTIYETTPYEGAWGTFIQLHPGLGTNGPCWSFSAKDQIYFDLRAGDQSGGEVRTTYELSDGSLNLGDWIDFIVTVNYKKDSTGFVNVLRRNEGDENFTQMVDDRDIPTLQWDATINSGEVPDHNMKHGFYRNPQSFTSVLYLDGFTRTEVRYAEKGGGIYNRNDGKLSGGPYVSLMDYFYANYGEDEQANDDYEVDVKGASALVEGMTITFKANTANTGGATLEITSIGYQDAILKMNDQALATGDIEAGQIVVCVWDGSNWQMTSQLAQ